MSSQSRGAFAVEDDVWDSSDYPAPVFDGEPGRDERTFPAPWNVDQIAQGYRILDAEHRVLAYVVAGDQGTKDQSGGLTLEEAQRIARVIASLPDLIIKAPPGRTKRSWWTSIRRSR
jgi:hypothetical protein